MQKLSVVGDSEFPTDWYDHASDDHFWAKWRFRALRRQLRALGLDVQHPLSALDIGCAHGLVQRQLEATTSWRIDGCDLNQTALARNHTARGDAYLYDIHDRRAAFREAFDIIILYDVIEHIEEPKPFLESAIWHLKPNGTVLVNVPALNSLFSRYDEAAGHFRRYTRRTLRDELQASRLHVTDLRYWGFSMLPLLALRKVMLSRQKRSEDILRLGFKPPHPVIDHALNGLGCLEATLLGRPPLGTSVMAAARKVSNGGVSR